MGARGGISKRWRAIEPLLRVVGFEPDKRSFQTLQEDDRPRRRILDKALADRPGPVTFHLTRDAGDSSILRPNRAFLDRFENPERFDVVGTETFEADTLDGQLAGIGVADVDFLKLDTQGSELRILRGATETLKRGVFGIEVEVELNPMYEGQPLFADVDALLRPFGYELFELTPRWWKRRIGAELVVAKGQIVWADAVYLMGVARAQEWFRAHSDGEEREACLARAVAVCVLYGFGDYALELVDAASADVAQATREQLAAAIREHDDKAKTPAVTYPVTLTPKQLRRLDQVRATTDLRPTEQIRRAISAWLDAQTRVHDPQRRRLRRLWRAAAARTPGRRHRSSRGDDRG